MGIIQVPMEKPLNQGSPAIFEEPCTDGQTFAQVFYGYLTTCIYPPPSLLAPNPVAAGILAYMPDHLNPNPEIGVVRTVDVVCDDR